MHLLAALFWSVVEMQDGSVWSHVNFVSSHVGNKWKTHLNAIFCGTFPGFKVGKV